MNKAVTPTLNELRKNVRFGSTTLGEELLSEGVKGGPKKLLQIADDRLAAFENELQTVLTSPSLEEARITRQQILPHLKDLIEAKAATPGLQGDAQRIKGNIKSIPEALTLTEANEMKRRIYGELNDPAYKLDAKLSTKGQALKKIASALKTEIENTVGGTVVKDINRKLSIYGRLQNTITDQLARSMKNHALGLTDALLLIAGGAGTVIALTNRASLSDCWRRSWPLEPGTTPPQSTRLRRTCSIKARRSGRESSDEQQRRLAGRLSSIFLRREGDKQHR